MNPGICENSSAKRGQQISLRLSVVSILTSSMMAKGAKTPEMMGVRLCRFNAAGASPSGCEGGLSFLQRAKKGSLGQRDPLSSSSTELAIVKVSTSVSSSVKPFSELIENSESDASVERVSERYILFEVSRSRLVPPLELDPPPTLTVSLKLTDAVLSRDFRLDLIGWLLKERGCLDSSCISRASAFCSFDSFAKSLECTVFSLLFSLGKEVRDLGPLLEEGTAGTFSSSDEIDPDPR